MLNMHAHAVTVRIQRAGLVSVDQDVGLTGVEGYCWWMRSCCERVAWIAWLWTRTVRRTCDLRRVERDRQDSTRVGVLTVQSSSVVRSIGKRAADLKASSSIGGSAFPRFSARRRIPSHALRLK